jgi:PAS domain S-box-containing protein
MPSIKHDRFVYKATLSYAVLASLWIFASDRLLALITDIENVVWLSTVKGLVFVALTTVLLYLALKFSPQVTTQGVAFADMHTAAKPQAQRSEKIILYIFSVVMSVAMLVAHFGLTILTDDRPLLVLFMFPIILSALLGGLGPGLVATFTCAIGIARWGLPPVGTLKIGNPHDLLQWLMLIINGSLVSALSESVRHAHRQTQRHQRELMLTAEQLRYSEDRLRLAQDAARAGTWEWQIKDERRYWSQEVWALFGLQSNGQAPHSEQWLDSIHPAHREATRQHIMDAVARRASYEAEWRVNLPEGSTPRWLLTRGHYFPGADGEDGRYLGIVIDISERKLAEAEVIRLNAELEQRVLERTAELIAANRELDAFAYAVSHDLRAPLRAMSGLANITIDDYAPLLPAEGRKHLMEIDLAGRKMGELIDALLTLSRSTRGGIQFDNVAVSDIARRIFTELSRQHSQHVIRIDIQPDLNVRGDARLIEVVLRNLLGNAWKYSTQSPTPIIRVYAEQRGAQRYICIADNGAGFDMAYANRLFQPFQRLHRQDEFPGIGIGLATVQRIVHRHGGSIEAQGAVGVGATFRFTLPTVQAKGFTEASAT